MLSKIETRKFTSESSGSLPPFLLIKNPPKQIFVRGKSTAFELLDKLPERGLAIVGTRNPQPRSEAQVKTRIRELKKYGLTIISGLARGIDACAHQAALDFGLPTIAILGCGLDISYPKENEQLRERILNSNGLLISEYENFEEARPHYFLLRNRLIAGLAKATWVVEASYRSGALNTAKWAREQDRVCFATPCFPGDPALAGNENLFRRGEALPLWTVEDLSRSWIELHSAAHFQTPLNIPSEVSVSGPASSVELLKKEIQNQTSQQGSAAISELLNWSVHQGWSPQLFYDSLQKGLADGLFFDRNGVVFCAL